MAVDGVLLEPGLVLYVDKTVMLIILNAYLLLLIYNIIIYEYLIKYPFSVNYAFYLII